MREPRSKEPFKVGDVVTWTTGGRQGYVSTKYYGKVTRITAAGTVFARSGKNESEFRQSKQHSYWGLQHVTKLELARAAWSQAKPTTKHADIERGYGNGMDDPPRGIRIHGVESPETALAAANEMIALAQWWGAYPKNPAADDE